LSNDLLDGRAPGTRGGDLATEYIATQFALARLKPAGDNGTYFQSVPLIGVTTDASARLSASKGGASGAGATDFKWADEFVGVNERQTPEDQFEAEVVFVGHGIVAPEYLWDDSCPQRLLIGCLAASPDSAWETPFHSRMHTSDVLSAR
jgi:hypothetical protein